MEKVDFVAATEHLVRAGIGVRRFDKIHDLFGPSVYEYYNERLTLLLFESGFEYEENGVRRDCAIAAIDDVELLTLKQLVKLRGPNDVAAIVVLMDGEKFQLKLPYSVYSSLAVPLCRAVQALKDHSAL